MHPLSFTHLVPRRLTERQLQSYRITRIFENAHTARGITPDCTEKYVSEAIRRDYGLPAGNEVIVPWEVLLRHSQYAGAIAAAHAAAGGGAVIDAAVARRAMSVSSASSGGYLVGDEVLSTEEVFRPVSAAARLGTQVLLSDPRGTGRVAQFESDPTFEWLAELQAGSDSTPTISSRDPGVHRIAGGVRISKQLLAQTDGATERLLAGVLLAAAGVAIDRGLLIGSGEGGEPAGLLSSATVLSHTYGGAADLQDLVDTVGELMDTNVPLEAGAGFAISPDTWRKWRAREQVAGAGRFLVDGGPAVGGFNVIGYPAQVTTHLADSDRTVFGRFASAAVYMLSGPGLPLIIDSYSSKQYQETEVWVDMPVRLDWRADAFVVSADSAAQ